MTRSHRLIALCLAALATTIAPRAQAGVEDPLDRVLAGVVGRDGRVDYGLLASRYRDDLADALQAVEVQDPGLLRSDDQKTAFLTNAYNAHVLARVVASPRAQNLERQGLFDDFFQRPVRVAGRSMTLNQLEHGVLRRQSRVDGAAVPAALRALRPARLDYRIHAALNCAAVSCPPLQRRAFRAATLDRDLAAAFSAFAASPRAARLDGRTLVLSSLFDWFADDFEAGGRTVGDVLLSAGAPSALRSRLAGESAAELRRDRSARFEYDWTVNRR